MSRSRPVVLAVAASTAVLVLVACGNAGDDGERSDPGGFDEQRAFADLRSQVEIGPRPAGSAASAEEARFIAGRLRAAGVDGVRIQRPHRNVVGVIPGTEPGAVVVGAHHDTKGGIRGFVGANDGASGVAVVLELARALPAQPEGPSIHLALFDAEEARGDRPFAEDGTRGSRQYVRYARRGGSQGSPRLGQVRAMVLFDLVGDCDLRIPREAGSDPRLYGLIADAADQLDGDPAPFVGESATVLDDHVPFLEAGVPAVDLIDFEFGPGPSPGAWWHTPEDSLDKVCPESLDAVGEVALRALSTL